MFSRKLGALNHPSAATFNSQNQGDYRNLILWLEDQKIRHYKIDQRQQLRDFNSDKWTEAFHKYLSDVGCPVLKNSPEEILDWLLGFAVRLEFADGTETYKKYDSRFIADLRAGQPKIVSSNPLDNLDFTTPEFTAGVNTLADFLNINKHPDHLVTLQAICKLVSHRLNPKAIQNPKSVIPEGKAFDFREHDPGFDTGDKVLNEAAQILRLLYITDLRLLQTKINESIVAVQSVTANPKTDTRLGKVGR